MPDAMMIFAAGLGTRMGELTRHRPKPLIEVSGQPLIAHALALPRAAGVKTIVVNIHAHADQMHAWLGAHAADCLVSHEKELLDTGGGLKRAQALLAADTVFTLNADMVWEGSNPVSDLARTWAPEEMDALLCLVPRETAIGHRGTGDFFRAPNGRLSRKGNAPSADFVYAGCQILKLAALERCSDGPFSLNRVWDMMLAEGRLFGMPYHGRWVDVGRPEGITLAETNGVR
ncbi:MAG: nucleotidyltransferase family protein [Pseudomonadota bacterium]